MMMMMIIIIIIIIMINFIGSCQGLLLPVQVHQVLEEAERD